LQNHLSCYRANCPKFVRFHVDCTAVLNTAGLFSAVVLRNSCVVSTALRRSVSLTML